MTTTKTKAPRVRAVNLYTVEQDGQPVAQAEAISQAEAIALWVASQQQPVLSARLATPRESRDLAHLPLLSRGGAVAPVDTLTIDLFEVAAPVADHVEETLKRVPEVAAAQPGEPAGCLDAAHTVAGPAGACLARAPGSDANVGTELQRQAAAAAERRALGGKVAAMYRDPATGQTWSGRGLRPRWLVEAIEAGKTLEDFAIGGAA